jgi:hypothetical protein
MKQCFKNFLFKLNSKLDIYMSIYRYYIVWLQIQFKSGTIYNDQQISTCITVIFKKMKTFHFQRIIWILNDMKER